MTAEHKPFAVDYEERDADGYITASGLELGGVRLKANWKEFVEGINAAHAAAVKEAVEKAVAEEREECAKIAENGRFLHGDAPDARFGKACAAAIRARGKA